MTRTDSSLIKHLTNTVSLDAAGVYNRLPLFVMPEGSDEIMGHERELLDAAPDPLLLPFDDFLLDFPFGTEPLFKQFKADHSRGRLWVRVRRFQAIRRDDAATTLRWDQLVPLLNLSDGILLEGWEEKTAWGGGLPPYPDYSAVNITRECIGDFHSHWHIYPCPKCPDGRRMMGGHMGWCNIKHCVNPAAASRCHASELIQATMCRLVVLSLIYLSEGLGGVVTKVSYRPQPGSREEKTERLKPWVAPRRELYLVIDPTRAADYGHPSGRSPAGPGHHASPIPHPRRGHWRWLSPDRRVKIPATWVGAREWVYEGRTYKIINQKEGR